MTTNKKNYKNSSPSSILDPQQSSRFATSQLSTGPFTHVMSPGQEAKLKAGLEVTKAGADMPNVNRRLYEYYNSKSNYDAATLTPIGKNINLKVAQEMQSEAERITAPD